MLYKKKTINIKTELERLNIFAEAIVKSTNKMGLAAAGISAQDLAGGVDFILSQQKETSFQWVSANMMLHSSSETVFKPYIIKEIGSLKIAVLGITDHSINLQPTDKGKIKILGWEQVLQSHLESLEKEADFIILLSSYPLSENERIARELKKIDLILQSGHSKNNLPPAKVGNTLITQTSSMGKYLGKLALSIHPGSTWGEGIDSKLKQAQNELDRINWQLNRLTKRIPEQELSGNIRYNKLLTSKSEYEKKIASLKTGDKVLENTFDHRFISLKTSLQEDKSVQSIIDQAKRTANKLSMERLLALSKQELDKEKGSPLFNNLVGWKKCKECHPVQTDFWLTTRHSRAWSTLVNKNEQTNPDCIICHITLESYNKSFDEKEKIMAQLPEHLQSVSCEACHGPGQDHVTSQQSLREVNEKTCRNCHNDHHDSDFNYENMVEKIRCPSL